MILQQKINHKIEWHLLIHEKILTNKETRFHYTVIHT